MDPPPKQEPDHDDAIAEHVSADPESQRPTASRFSTNPLLGLSSDEIMEETDKFVVDHNLHSYCEVFRKGALAAKAQNMPGGYEVVSELSEDDKELLRFEENCKWKSCPKMMFFLTGLCGLCAVVQGTDQTVVNGAQEFYIAYFGITDKLLEGVINGAPYIAAALIGCWLNAPLNKWFGRRGTIFISCFIVFAAAIWQAVASTWQQFIIARLFLGIAVGAKSSTTPIYAAESAPKNVRGALTMMWQMWTAFGIMLGFIISLALSKADGTFGPNTQWRWMLGVTAVPPMIVASLVYFLPESPRWYMDKKKFRQAFMSMKKLRFHDMLAARDLFLAYKYLQVEEAEMSTRSTLDTIKSFWKVPRIRRAAQCAYFCMFMQQFCGVNVIAYYSTRIFIDSGYSQQNALVVSLGAGICNFLGAIPAVLTIDRVGRRRLMLYTFPALSIFLFVTGAAFNLASQEARLAVVATFIYLFMIAYSPGLGPVPFTYSAEAFPLNVRALGMASATAVTWLFNFVISFTWPKMMATFTTQGGFYWYAAWNIFGLIFAYFLVPETKRLTLEELDGVFSVSNHDFASDKKAQLKRAFKKGGSEKNDAGL